MPKSSIEKALMIPMYSITLPKQLCAINFTCVGVGRHFSVLNSEWFMFVPFDVGLCQYACVFIECKSIQSGSI